MYTTLNTIAALMELMKAFMVEMFCTHYVCIQLCFNAQYESFISY